jgi:hypothetical protein
MNDFDIKNPKEKKYFEKRCDTLIFLAIFSIFIFSILLKFSSELESSSKIIETAYNFGIGISFFTFIVG